MIAWARAKIASSFPWHCRGGRRDRLGKRPTHLFAKEVMRLATTGWSHDQPPSSEQLLPDPLGRSLPLPAMVGVSVSAATVLYTRRLPVWGEPRTRSEADKFPPPPALLPIPARSSGVSIAGSQKVVYDKISDVATQSLAGCKVEEKMHTGKDAAQRCFFRGSWEACE